MMLQFIYKNMIIKTKFQMEIIGDWLLKHFIIIIVKYKKINYRILGFKIIKQIYRITNKKKFRNIYNLK